MFSNGSNLDQLNGYTIRLRDRAGVNILPLTKAQASYDKSVDAMLKSIDAVKTIIEQEGKKYSAETAKADDTIADTKNLHAAAQDELNDLITRDNISDTEAGIAAGGRITYFERKLRALETNKTAIPLISDAGKKKLRVALAAAQAAQFEYEKARRNYYFSIDKELIERGINLLSDASNRHFGGLSDIVGTQAVKDAFIIDPEITKMNLSSSDLINLILYSGE